MYTDHHYFFLFLFRLQKKKSGAFRKFDFNIIFLYDLCFILVLFYCVDFKFIRIDWIFIVCIDSISVWGKMRQQKLKGKPKSQNIDGRSSKLVIVIGNEILYFRFFLSSFCCKSIIRHCWVTIAWPVVGWELNSRLINENKKNTVNSKLASINCRIDWLVIVFFPFVLVHVSHEWNVLLYVF